MVTPVVDEQSRAIIANRLKKNFKHLSRWARRNQVDCYRVYDADIPEYSAAIDIYKDWVCVQEYEAPKSIDSAKAEQRLNTIIDVIPESLGTEKNRIVLKTRRQQKGLDQYEKHSDVRHEMTVVEGGLKFYVNLYDYLDTGLFLDHRITRSMIREMAQGKRFLNLFSYTGSVSVYAAAGGASSTTTVDMSKTYLEWAKRNFDLNGFAPDTHEFIQQDCIKWLKQQSGVKNRYDLIFIDPPTFSNSKRMESVFDVQRDHVFLIESAMKLMSDDGILVFSNNFRKFKLDAGIERQFEVRDISVKTIPEDFRRNQKIHRCWIIRHT
jgi:23S rRNA (guanine2445-N2)-methyltransferase / 23S rRNA (guanine2069-N7)-methyltransferase